MKLQLYILFLLSAFLNLINNRIIGITWAPARISEDKKKELQKKLLI